MDNPLAQLMSLGQVQQEQQKRYSDALREKRALQERASQFQQIAGQAGQQFAGALDANNPVILNPADVFKSFGTFNAGIVPQIEAASKYTGDQDILKQIADIAATREANALKGAGGDSLMDLLKTRQALKDAGRDTTAIDAELDSMGLTKQKDGEVDLTTQINNIGTSAERNGARAVKDILDVVNTAIDKSQGVETGPISSGKAALSKLFTPNKTAQLEKDLSEILRTIRKESTGVAFSPQEIADLQKEIPTIMQQEGNVADSLIRLKQRMLQKLTNYGLDVTQELTPGSPKKSSTVLMQSPDGNTYEVDASEADEAAKNGWKRK